MKTTKLLTVALTTLVAGLATAGSAQAATDYFLKVEPMAGDQPIVGESVDREFPKAIQISSFSMSAENATTIGGSTGGAGAGKAQFKELTVEKPVDSTTPQFFQRLATGRHMASIEIIARTVGATGPAAVATRYYFQTVFVKSQEQRGDAEGISETLTLVYGGLAQAAARTGTTQNVFSSWSQVTNTIIKDPLPIGYR